MFVQSCLGFRIFFPDLELEQALFYFKNFTLKFLFNWAASLQSWNYNTNRNNISENFFIKVYWIRHDFEEEHDSL